MSRTYALIATLAVVFAGVAGLVGFLGRGQGPEGRGATPPAVMRPPMEFAVEPGQPPAAGQRVIDLTEPGAVVWGSAPVEIFDTRTIEPQIQRPPAGQRVRAVREILPPHERPGALLPGTPNALPLGGILEAPRARVGGLFPGINQTGWVPPDDTIGVGPSHVIATVNMAIAFYTKSGTQQFYVDLSSAGNPGFFEPVGAGGFTFDPKCLYDHLAERFVVIAPEVYGDSQAWICIAVSDDSDPNGIWYKYRTNAVITVGAQTYWWDYPGFGYDADAYYVTGNLFGLNQGGWGGVGFRIFAKAPLLDGSPASFADLRDATAASVQVAQHFGDNPAPYFVSVGGGSTVRVHAIQNPLTAPSLASTNVTVPQFAGPFSAPAAGGRTVDLIDARIMNAHWRDGNLYAAHHISADGRNFARWYHLQTNGWPVSGNVTYVQSGNVDGGTDVHTWFPAIYSNKYGEIGMVMGASSATDRISVNVTGRTPADPPGTMGALTQVQVATVNGGGRWGDYYDVVVDPADDETFWVVGEYPASFGWANWVASFRITEADMPVPVPDDLGLLFYGDVRVVDVMGNDYHTGDLAISLSSFDATSVLGGTVTLSAGTGPGGRDELIYTAPTGASGADSFTYTIIDTLGATAVGSVTANVVDASAFRVPENPQAVLPGMQASYYVLPTDMPPTMPDYDAMTPYAVRVVPQIAYNPTYSVFANSGRSNWVGAVFEGYLDVPETAFYTLYTSSDDGSLLYVGDTLVVDNNGSHGMADASGTVGLQAGRHAIRIEYFEMTLSAGLVVSIEGEGAPRQPIPASQWLRAPRAGDMNCDDVVDAADLPAFVLALVDPAEYEATYPACHPSVADVDGSGLPDAGDVQAYVGLLIGG